MIDILMLFSKFPLPGEELVKVLLGEALAVLHVVVPDDQVHLTDKDSLPIFT